MKMFSEPFQNYTDSLMCAFVQTFNTVAARLQIYRTWKLGENQGYFGCLSTA